MMRFYKYIGMSYSVPDDLQTNPDDPNDTVQQKCNDWEEELGRIYYMGLFFTDPISNGIRNLEKQYLNYCKHLEDNYKQRVLEGYETETKIGVPADFLLFVRWTLEVYKDHKPFDQF